MTLRARLAFGLAIIALVLIVPLVFARASMQRLHDDMTQLRTHEFASSLLLGSLRDDFGEVRSRQLALEIVKDDTVHQQLLRTLALAQSHADSLVRRTDTALRPLLPMLATMRLTADREYQAWHLGHDDEGDSIAQNVMVPAIDQAERLLRFAEKVLSQGTQSRVDRAEVQLKDAQDVSIAGLVLALGLAAIVSLWLTRSISGPVEALERGMRAVADGELEHSLDVSPKRRDEFGKLAISFQVMSRQLAELDKLKAEFISVASHELKTPINVILGYLQLMQDGIYGPLSTKQEEVLGTIEAQGRTLARLASHLLDVTRFEAGGGRIEPRPVRLAGLLQDLERAFHVLAVQRNIDFRVTLRPGLPSEVQWDSDRINEVMGNLLANAFKFTHAGGRVELIATPSDERVRIEVRDTGAGIPPAQLPHIFEKFYQADNQRSASATGSGLGLAIAKEIVEAHRGEIRCASALGTGTTFTLLLPVVVSTRRRTGSHRTVHLEAAS